MTAVTDKTVVKAIKPVRPVLRITPHNPGSSTPCLCAPCMCWVHPPLSVSYARGVKPTRGLHVSNLQAAHTSSQPADSRTGPRMCCTGGGPVQSLSGKQAQRQLSVCCPVSKSTADGAGCRCIHAAVLQCNKHRYLLCLCSQSSGFCIVWALYMTVASMLRASDCRELIVAYLDSPQLTCAYGLSGV